MRTTTDRAGLSAIVWKTGIVKSATAVYTNSCVAILFSRARRFNACWEDRMKRIAVLIDGTWNKEGPDPNTNVAKLDPGNKIVTQAFIPEQASGGIAQHVIYHDG